MRKEVMRNAAWKAVSELTQHFQAPIEALSEREKKIITPQFVSFHFQTNLSPNVSVYIFLFNIV